MPEIVAAIESLDSIPNTVEIRFELMNLPECLRPTPDSFEVERLDAESTRDILDLVRQSLQGSVTLPTAIGLDEPKRLDLSLFFSGSFRTLRPCIPTFDNLRCTATSVPATVTGETASGDAGSLFLGRTREGGTRLPLGYFPDSTFGGISPDFTQRDINSSEEPICLTLVGCTPINIPVTTAGNISESDGESLFRAGRFSDCYTFFGNAGRSLALLLQSDDFIPEVFVVRSDGLLDISPSFDCFMCSAHRLPALRTTGTYVIEVTSSTRGGATGGYILTVSE